MGLQRKIASCKLCAGRFAATETRHAPRPVTWFGGSARVLIAGQAPGLRVHESGKPFTDRSGDRLRQWMNVDEATFYDTGKIAIVPMAFCFPGYDAKGSDLPPPKLCANTWRASILDALGHIPLTLLIGGYAQTWHLSNAPKTVTETVRAWQEFLPAALPLPHPSWRNTAWIKKNPWFEADVLPALRARVAEALA